MPFARFYSLFIYLYYLSVLHSAEGEFIGKLTNLDFGSSFTIVNTDFEMQQTKIFHRESHAPFLLRMYLFDMIGKMRIARLKQRRRRIDHSGVIHELDMSRKGSFVLQEISNKFVNAFIVPK